MFWVSDQADTVFSWFYEGDLAPTFVVPDASTSEDVPQPVNRLWRADSVSRGRRYGGRRLARRLWWI